MDVGMERERTWRHILLGESWETSTPEDRAEFLLSLENDSDYSGIWFKRASGDDDDDQLVTDILEAIRLNPWVSGLCFQDLEDKFPVQWLNEILFTRGKRIQELRIMSGNIVEQRDVGTLSRGLANSSLKELYLDYPSLPLLAALTVALKSDTSQLDIMGIADIPHDGYVQLAPALCHCESLKELILTGASVNLDSNIDDLIVALVSHTPYLEIFSFEFGYATTRAFTKLTNALATKDLKSLSFGCSEDYEEHVALADPTPVERVIETNRRLEYFKVITTQISNEEDKELGNETPALKYDEYFGSFETTEESVDSLFDYDANSISSDEDEYISHSVKTKVTKALSALKKVKVTKALSLKKKGKK